MEFQDFTATMLDVQNQMFQELKRTMNVMFRMIVVLLEWKIKSIISISITILLHHSKYFFLMMTQGEKEEESISQMNKTVFR